MCVITQRCSIAERGGCFQRRRCLSVCQFVCQHDNFRAIKRRTMKLGDLVHCANVSPEIEFGCQRSKVKVTGDKKSKKCSIFSGAVLKGASTPVGKSAHAV